MNWQDIKVSADNTHFLFEGKPIFNKHFMEVLKLHSPGLAPVQDETGAYHIDTSGVQLYAYKYLRTFGYYCNRAAVIKNDKWFHLTENGTSAYQQFFAWTGNYQENLCSVRDINNSYFHIDLNGEQIYSQTFLYAGDYKDGFACVKTASGYYKHIDTKGNYLNNIEFEDLGIFHKNFATAKDNKGWHHINKSGNELYSQRYLNIEPFYNGFSLVINFDNQKSIINERGGITLNIGF
jgi:hypothetical protein